MREILAAPPLLVDVDKAVALDDRNIKKCTCKVCDGHYTTVVWVLSSSGVASYNNDTLVDLQAKHPPVPAPSLPSGSVGDCYLVAPLFVVLSSIKGFPRGTACGRNGLRAQDLMDYFNGA